MAELEARRELLHALELAHYAQRFRRALFVIALPSGQPLRELLLDLKVLSGYHIQVVLVTHDPDGELRALLETANSRGANFYLTVLPHPESPRSREWPSAMRGVLRRGQLPVVAFRAAEPESEGVAEAWGDAAYALGAEIARRLEASKLFLITPLAAVLRSALTRSHVLARDVKHLLDGVVLPPGQSELARAWLPLIQQELEHGLPDLILLEGRFSQLFREVFTHDGAGILFNQASSTAIRKAELRDVTDIALLLEPEIEAGRVLPISEEQIEADLAYYHVYDIDGLCVGLARIKPFGETGELAQFATLPRYRGRGRARELAVYLEQQARGLGLKRVFALSIDTRMWEFFQGLDFVAVPRESLPAEWLARYDLSRPSRAFLKEL